jgi:hypothetical protein
MTDDALIRELADKQAITELVHAYCRAVDRLDVALGHSVFHKDGYADYGATFYQGSGRALIDKICQDHLPLAGHAHQITNILISLDGDDAGSESYVTGSLWKGIEGRTRTIGVWGRYCDRWQRREGQWGILHRVFVLDHQEVRESETLSGHGMRGQRDRTDPSYSILAGRS